MLLKKLLLLISLLFVFLYFSSHVSVFAQDAKELENKIKEYQGKINELQGQAKTLNSQIQVMDNQIKVTEYRIQSTENQKEALTKDIGSAAKRIDNLEGSLDKVSEVMFKRIVTSYQLGGIEPIHMLFSSEGVDDYFKRVNYVKIVRKHDQEVLVNTQQAKSDYENQKNIFEAKKQKVLLLSKQLEEYTKQLDNQKNEKQALLSATKSSESEYQGRLADATRELRAISRAAKVLISTEPRKVGRGEQIGVMGNTGYSFGAHLHFGIYNAASLSEYSYYGGYENPANSLEAKVVMWDSSCSSDPSGKTVTGSGSFAWPMSTDNLHITQASGQTCYSSIYYGGNPHPAFDMYNNSDTTVRAAEEGQAYYCRNCTGDGGNGVFLFHPNGKMSLYWHLQ